MHSPLIYNPSPANIVFIVSDLLLLLFSYAVHVIGLGRCALPAQTFQLRPRKGREPEQAHDYGVKKLVNISLGNTDWSWWDCDLSLNKKACCS